MYEKKQDLVIDPNESWKDFFKSMIAFEEPKLVPVDSLSEEQHPKNRKLGSVKYMINWRGQNHLESWTPLSHSTVYSETDQNKLNP